MPLQPIDRFAIGLILLLNLLIGLLIWTGDRTVPQVREFSWQNKQIGAEDNFFTITFSRPMDRASVEANLQIEPPLAGKISWAGRRMIYTINSPAHYETTYKLALEKAQDQFTAIGKPGKLIKPFVGQFHTRDRAFAYIGIEGEEKGRLILYNLTQKQKTILTPKDQVVTDFKPYPDGDRILFSATNWLNYKPGLFEEQLYTVTTGISPQSTETFPAGEINLVLDSNEYQNMRFDLSPDGQTIVVQRVNRNNLGKFGLWVLQPDSPPKPLNNQPGGEFLIAPDSNSVAITQGQGIAILPLKPNTQPLDFLPKFGKIMSFAKDGSSAAMVKFNANYTRSLYLVTNQGIEKKLLDTTGEIFKCQFSPSSTTLYCLITQLVKNIKQGNEPLDLKAIDLKTSAITTITSLPNQTNIEMSLSTDGLILLFDRIITTVKLPKEGDLSNAEGGAIASSHLLLLSPNNNQPQLQKFSLAGFRPRWLP